ncbi:MAG: hypothetical protein HOP29_06140 [Phycisphaerales bacterium]|nr:hypothetical protein [Phycisphaerales bacterium]
MFTNSRILGQTIVLALLGCVIYGNAAQAQCDPPAANTKCWTGGGVGGWSDEDNWNPAVLPQSTDTVYHLIGGPINVDIGSYINPVLIADFRFGPTPGSMTVQAGKVIFIDEGISPSEFEAAGTLELTLEDGARLLADTVIDHVDVHLKEGSSGPSTLDIVPGTIGAGNWTLEGNTILIVDVIDLTGAPANARTWNTQGDIRVQSSIFGDGDWTLSKPPGYEGVITVPYHLEASRLTIEGGAFIDSGAVAVPGWPNFLHITESLSVRDADAYQTELIHHHGNLIADAGSTISLSNGGRVEVGYASGFDPSLVDDVEYGVDGPGFANWFAHSAGLVFTEASSTLRAVEGAGSHLNLDIGRNGLDILSKIHEEASDWDSSGVTLFVQAYGGDAPVEVTSPDFDGIWFTDSPCIKPWGELDLLTGGLGDISLVDDRENSRAGVNADTGLPEALYVDHLILHFGSAADLNGLNLYYATVSPPDLLCLPPAFPDGCFTHAITTLYGDYDGDEIADDAGDAARFLAAYPCMDANAEYDALADWDCDGVISYVEHQKYLANWPGASGLGDECAENGPCLDRDVCSFSCCMEGDNVCSFQEAAYGDVIGGDNICGQLSITCGPDGQIDIFDILGVLNAFGSALPEGCAYHNFDLSPCSTDGVIDIFDVLAVLDAFSGIDACCGGGAKVMLAAGAADVSPDFAGGGATRVSVTTGIQSVKARAEGDEATESPASTVSQTGRAKVVASETQLALVPKSNSVDAGETVAVDVFADDVTDLRGYQLRLSGTDAVPVDVYVDTEREDYVFYGADARHAEDMENHRMVVALVQGGVTQTGRVYLGTFVFKADESAGSSPTPEWGGAPNGIRAAIHPFDGMILVDPTGAVLDVATPSSADVAVR